VPVSDEVPDEADEVGAGSAAGVVCPVDAGGEVGAVAWGCAVLPQAASVHSKTAAPAGASSLVYLRVREPPKKRRGFNGHQQPS
jgi:hypothetical protein